MKIALVIVEADGDIVANRAALEQFAHRVATLTKQTPAIESLNVGAYLVRLEHGMLGLANLIGEAAVRKLQTRTLFFDHDPAFVITKPA